MNYKVQGKKKRVFKPMQSNARWPVGRLKVELDLEKCNCRMKQVLNYSEAERDEETRLRENLKHIITTAVGGALRSLRQHRKPWISEKL